MTLITGLLGRKCLVVPKVDPPLNHSLLSVRDTKKFFQITTQIFQFTTDLFQLKTHPFTSRHIPFTSKHIPFNSQLFFIVCCVVYFSPRDFKRQFDRGRLILWIFAAVESTATRFTLLLVEFSKKVRLGSIPTELSGLSHVGSILIIGS